MTSSRTATSIFIAARIRVKVQYKHENMRASMTNWGDSKHEKRCFLEVWRFLSSEKRKAKLVMAEPAMSYF
jgi:hypothetical protein